MYYRVFWQRRCRAAAAGEVLKPSGGNCAVLPYRTQARCTVSGPVLLLKEDRSSMKNASIIQKLNLEQKC
ncbi:MAG: hypothetical protein MSB96_04075, partial [Subdoligranulum sp.]|nr:hypothetical protein [Subdoligranulum sp.]